MAEVENIVAKIKDNKKAIGENAHVISIILLVAFIVVDVIIILYLINENDKYHTVYPDVSRSTAVEIKDYLIAQGIEATLNKSGQVVVAKELVDYATNEVQKKFFPVSESSIPINDNEDLVLYNDSIDPQTLLATNELEIIVANSLQNHVAIEKAVVRIDDYGSRVYEVSATVVITPVSGMDLNNADIDTISWLIASLIDDCKSENITLINANTNSIFEGGTTKLY